MVAHRFVQIHRIENRRIEAGEQLLGDDENLGLFPDLGEVLADLFLFLAVRTALNATRPEEIRL
jgi:hypothetical protein